MQTFVINLDGATARRAHMETVLGAAGIAFERLAAIEGGRTRQHPAFDQLPHMRGRPWTEGELGCLLSHYEVWRRIAAGPDAFGGVLEDDVFVDPRLRAVLAGDCAMPPDADLVKLEAVTHPALVSRRSTAGPGGPAFHRLHSRVYGTGAYLVSRRTAQFLVGSIAAFDMPVDDALFDPTHPVGSRLKVYQAIPALAIQSSLLPDAAARPELRSLLEMERFANAFLNGRQRPDLPTPAPGPTRGRDAKAPAAGTLQRWREKLFMRRIMIQFGGAPGAT